MLISTGNFDDILDLSFQKIAPKVKATEEEPSREFYYYDTVKDFTVKDSSVTDYVGFGERSENQDSLAVDQYQGYDKTYNIVCHDGFLRITEKMQMAFEARDLASKIGKLQNAFVRYKEERLHGPLNNMTSTTYTDTSGDQNVSITNSGGDGVCPQSTAHTREDSGSNFSNKIVMGATSNPDFAYDALKAAHTVAQAIPGPVGEKWNLNPDILIVATKSAAHFEAMEILDNLKTGGPRTKPDVTSNSGAARLPFRIVDTPYLTTTTNWMMQDSKKLSDTCGFQYKELQQLTFDAKGTRQESGEIRQRAKAYFQHGFGDLARCMIMSDGTNA